MKYLMGQIPILLRGKEKVQVEIDLYSTAYNLIRLKNTEIIPVLLAKLEKWNPIAGFFSFLSYHLTKKKLLSVETCSKQTNKPIYLIALTMQQKNTTLRFSHRLAGGGLRGWKINH